MARPKKQTPEPVSTADGIDDDDRAAVAAKEKTPRKRLEERGILPSVQRLAVKDLIPTEDNARTICEHSAAFVELADSVRASGVKMPVIVRPHPSRPGKYDLRAGARRLRAAQLANLKQIPAMVYEGLSDEDAFDLTFFENYGREDLTPMEEAMAAAILLEHHRGDLQAVADKFDKPPAWVKRRSYVHKHLAEEWKVAVAEEGSSFGHWTISHLELVARFDADTQRRFLEDFPSWIAPETVFELENWLGKFVRTLDKAPWDPDEVLIDEPSGEELTPCGQCPKRSGCQPLLWADGDGDTSGQADRCLDQRCWDRKRALFLAREFAARKAHHPGLQPATLKADYRLRQQVKSQFAAAVELEDTTLPAKRNDPDAVPYFVVGGTSEGQVKWRKPRPGMKAASSAKGKKTLRDRQAELDSKRYHHVLRSMGGMVRAATVADIVYQDKTRAVLALVSVFGAAGPDRYRGAAGVIMDIDDVDGQPVESLLEDVFTGVKPRLLETIAYSGPISQVPELKIDAARSLAHLLQINMDELFETACAAIPTPKSLLAAPPKERAEDPDGDAEDQEDA